MIEELTTHSWIEEKIFYPAAREAAPDTKDYLLESVEEHHVVLWMLSDCGCSPNSRTSPRPMNGSTPR
ncbi:hypothetical protein OG840_21050 [Streptomyces sp. NBC_01764]|uniref:hypothetical protein n=1 Tax=Streptomyces sp. NBC_01764 TaxID=2975935 RepID=UPI00224D5F7F|nr:hypothetical protein [Streptomyces sp. NBC_01764]MCX4404141.1 hypothetical protein [Streptomyces sp. NBC_01764]